MIRYHALDEIGWDNTIARQSEIGMAITIGYGATNLRSCEIIVALRAEQAKHAKQATRFPCDVHVLGVSPEAPDRLCTKLFGRPARPSNKPWPTYDDGKAFQFVGQFNFSLSRDILPELPGDMLLVFAKEVPIVNSGDVDELYFEWYSIADVEESMLPNCREYLVDESCFWGQPVRTYDFDNIEEISGISKRLLKRFTDIEDGFLRKVEDDPAPFARCRGMKIGGLPAFDLSSQLFNGFTEWSNGISFDEVRFDEFEYICGFGSIGFVRDWWDPYMNRHEPLGESIEPCLFWCDGFQCYFFWHPVHGVRWVVDYPK